MVHPAASTGPVLSSTQADATPPMRLLFWETTAGCNLECVHCRRLDVSRELSKDDMTTAQATAMIRSLRAVGRPIVVFSGGEPLMRPDIFELAHIAAEAELPTALATNGTMIDDAMADRVVQAGFRRTAISFDGPDASTHDRFRGLDGSFDAAIRGFEALRDRGMSMQVNSTITRHNVAMLDQTYERALRLGADALHLFMLVPVGCGMELDPSVQLTPEEYEAALHWIHDRADEGRLQLKATCAPHYFRIARQRAKREGARMPTVHGQAKPGAGGQAGGHPGGQTGGMHTMTKGCLAGQAVAFVSHTGEVFPCGYLPVSSGNVTRTGLPAIWRDSAVFADLRGARDLSGKCGCCEYQNVCMGCRARAFAATGDYLAEEPSCDHVPVTMR